MRERLFGDERLARAAAGGNDDAFAVLDSRYRRLLLGYAVSLVRNEHDAEDVVQATLLNALRALREDPRQPPVRPWLFRIAHNEAVSLLRRRRPQADIAEVDIATRSAAQDAELRGELRDLLEDLGRLSDRQRSALVMRELGGLSYDEVALALSTTPVAARQTVSAARLALVDQAEGRDTACADVRLRLAETDRRRLPRFVRAHLSGCEPCRTAAAATRRRRRTLRALVPLPGPWLLAQLLAAGGGAAGKVAIAITVTTVGITAEVSQPPHVVHVARPHAVAHHRQHEQPRQHVRIAAVKQVKPQATARPKPIAPAPRRVKVTPAPRATVVAEHRRVAVPTPEPPTFVVATPAPTAVVTPAPTATPEPPAPTPTAVEVAATPTPEPRHGEWHQEERAVASPTPMWHRTPVPTATPSPDPTEVATVEAHKHDRHAWSDRDAHAGPPPR